MYEDKKFVKKRISWSSVFLKLLLLFLIVFLIWFVFFRKTAKKKETVKGREMSENLKVFKRDSINYFTSDKLPKNVGEIRKVTLEQMIKDGATKDIIDKKGNTCSRTSSYAQVVKTAEKSYDLKVYVKCKNEADSIITTLGNKPTNNNNTNTNKNSNTNNNANKNTNNTNTNKNTNSTKTNTNKTTKTTTNNNKTTTTKTTTNTNITNNTNKNTNNTNTTNNNSNTNTNTNTNSNTASQTSNVGTFTPDASKLLYTEYKLIKYGDATNVKPTSGSYTTSVYRIVVNKYCVGTDYENCHKIPKLDKYKNEIDYYLMQGMKEIYDHTEQITLYIPYETIWSKTKDVAGYVFTGDSRNVYKMN